MLKNEEVLITLSSVNIKHFEDIGYDIDSLKVTSKKYTGIPRGTKLSVKIKDLKRNSTIGVEVVCDYCGDIFTKQYREYLNGNECGIIKKDCCHNKECLVKKRNESNLKIYGCENVFQNDSIKQKIKEVVYDKYGFEFVSQNPEIREKIRQTTILRYGTEHASQNDDIKQKTVETNIKKYGVSHFSKTDKFKEKIKNTCMDRYGVSHPMQNEEIKNRGVINSILSRYKHKSGVSSKQQRHIQSLIGGCLNYPVGRLMLDIAFVKEKIYVEYDGSGHNLSVKLGDITQDEFIQKEINRYYFLNNLGWRLVRFISSDDLLPSDEIIEKYFNLSVKYLNEGHSWIKVNFNNNAIECSNQDIVMI